MLKGSRDDDTACDAVMEGGEGGGSSTMRYILCPRVSRDTCSWIVNFSLLDGNGHEYEGGWRWWLRTVEPFSSNNAVGETVG